jgi:hypothetical protein
MKRYFILILLFLSSNEIFSQYSYTLPIDSLSNLVTFEEIIIKDSIDKNTLIDLCNEWLLYNNKDFKSNKKYLDKDNNTLIDKSIFSKINVGKGALKSILDVNYLITIKTKDNKIKIKVSNLNVYFRNSTNSEYYEIPIEKVFETNSYILKKDKKQFEEEIKERFNLTIASIEKYLNKASNESNW